MEIVTDFILRWLHFQESLIGEAELLIVADHVPNQVNPGHMKEFILPYMKAIYGDFPRAVKLYHNEGLHSPAHIDLIQRFGFDIWHFGSDQHTLEQIYPLLDEKIVPFGGLNPHGNPSKGIPRRSPAGDSRLSQGRPGAEALALFRHRHDSRCDSGEHEDDDPNGPLRSLRSGKGRSP